MIFELCICQQSSYFKKKSLGLLCGEWVVPWSHMDIYGPSMDKETRVTRIRLVALKWRGLEVGLGEIRPTSCIGEVLLLYMLQEASAGHRFETSVAIPLQTL